MSGLNDIEKRTEYFVNLYKGRLKFAGNKHSRIKQIQHLINNTKSNPRNLFVVEGIWGIEKVLEYKLDIEAFFFCPDHVYSPEALSLIDFMINKDFDTYLVAKKVFAKISERENPDGLMLVCELPKFNFADIRLSKNNVVVVLDGVEIPGNIGTIIRTVDGCGGDGVIICNRRARLTHPKLIKSSQGSNFTVPVIEAEIEEVINWLKNNGFKIYLTDPQADQEYHEETYPGRTAIVAGSERYGISEEWYKIDNKMISIPMYGDCDSLNVAIATTIVLYEAVLKQQGKIRR
ncbi:MAG: RNA methyltransferase [Halanaerobiales bacterium]|nr:RNA methyltransferase [Halanaerobiales bacterium]